MPHLTDIPKKMNDLLSQTANVTLAIAMLYIFQYIFNSEFPCSCTAQFQPLGKVYIAVIPVIMFFIYKMVKQNTSKSLSCMVCCHCSETCYSVSLQILQLFGIYLFWGCFILLDGDLYLCLMTKANATLRAIPCKKNTTFEENLIITSYKDFSRVLGIASIALGIIGWWLISKITSVGIHCESISWRSTKDCCLMLCKKEPYYKRQYEIILAKETNKNLVKNLKEIAKERAERMCTQHIQEIKQYELNKDRGSKEDIENSWATISKSHFYMSEISKDNKFILMTPV